jgi:hypothetical protein
LVDPFFIRVSGRDMLIPAVEPHISKTFGGASVVGRLLAGSVVPIEFPATTPTMSTFWRSPLIDGVDLLIPTPTPSMSTFWRSPLIPNKYWGEIRLKVSPQFGWK